MKKLSFLLAALAVALTASAAMPINGLSNRHEMKSYKHHGLAPAQHQRMADVVTDQPEGTVIRLTRSTDAGYLYVNSGYVYLEYQSGSVMAVLSDDGKTMWIRDIMSGLSLGTWVKGELNEDGTLLTVQLDQSIYSGTYTNDEGEVIPYEVKLCMGSLVETDDGYLAYEQDERATEVEFSIEGNTITMLNTEGATYIDEEDINSYLNTGLSIYYTDDDTWAGYLEWNTVYTNMGEVQKLDVITEQPEGELKTYYREGESLALEAFWYWYFLTYYEQEGKIDIVYAPDGKTVYIKDLLYGYNLETWVKGEIEDNKIIVPLNQCIYWSDDEMDGVVLGMADAAGTIDDEGFEYFNRTEEETIEFTIDGETLIMEGTSGTAEDDYYVVHGLTGYWNGQGLGIGSIDWGNTYTEVHIEPAIPADPEVINWEDKGNEKGNNRFFFTINMEDVDGNILDPDYVYYSIYTDNDEIFTFTADTYSYSGITEDMTDVPYSLQYYDLHPENGYVYFYRTNADGYERFFNERIGIQVHYIVNGEKNSSNIVYWYLPEVHPAVPVNPTADNWYDDGDEGGFSRFYFTITLEDVDGNELDPMHTYYSIYTDDDQIFTFDYDTYGYSGITDDVTIVPYTIQYYDLHPENGYVYFYRTNAEGYERFFNQRIGIQVHYIVDGEINSSDIVYWYLPEEPTPGDPVIPADPVAINWHDCGDESGYSYFDFQIFDRDVDGNPIDAENISYSIFVDDDQIFTFDADTYSYDLYTDMTEIPYWVWSDGYDIQSGRVYFYRTNEGDNPLFNQRIGIQVYYTVNGQRYASNIVYLDKDVSVNEVNAGKTIDKVRYFNVAGQEMSQPEGVTIQVTTYTDGTTSTVKVVK